jgi:hypothetical protein
VIGAARIRARGSGVRLRRGGAGRPGAAAGGLNVPNPTAGETRFLFDLGATADLQVVLHTASGHAIRRIEIASVTPAEARSTGLPWDGRDDDGHRVANGLYFYRVTARDRDGRSAERIEKLVVTR